MIKTILDEYKKAPYILAVFFFLVLGYFVYANYKQVTNHLPTKIGKLEGKIEKLEVKIEKLEVKIEKLDDKIDENQKELNKRIDKVNEKIEKNHNELKDLIIKHLAK